MTAAAADPGRLRRRGFWLEYGHDLVVVVDTGGTHPLRARCLGRFPIRVGDTVEISARGDVIAWQAEVST